MRIPEGKESTHQRILDYSSMLWRRKAWFIGPFIGAMVIAVLLILFLPKAYRSTTLILVEGQKVPEEFVRSTVSESLGGRLSTIQQEILSRSFLTKIVTQFHLFEDEKGTEEDIIEKMRKSVEIKTVVGHRDVDAFSISFIGRDPLVTMKVTNQLASLFIEQNLKIREQLVEGTTEFIDSELEGLKKTLERQEALVTQFKRTYSGELPGQLETNLRTLDRLQISLQEVKMAIRIVSERQLSERAFEKAAENAAEKAAEAADPLIQRLQAQKLRLVSLQLLYKDTHPDVLAIKGEIEELEKKLSARSREAGNSSILPPERRRDTTTNRELMELKEREAQLDDQIRSHERRIESVPQREQELTILLRDYENTQKNYQNLLDKKLNAKISENLEKRQKGEKFRILDPASFPEKPYKPNPVKVGLAGILLGVLGGLAMVVARENMDSSFHKPEDLENLISAPILASILDYQEMPRLPDVEGEAVSDPPLSGSKPSVFESKFLSMSKLSAPIRKMGAPLREGISRLNRVNPPRLQAPSDLISLTEPSSIISEQYRLLFLKLHHACQEQKRRTIAVTSSIKGEGKTTTVSNLAIIAARDFGKKTLLIDVDFKNPTVGKYFKLKQEKQAFGLMDVLTKRCTFESALVKGPVENLTILPIGRHSGKTADMLNLDGLHDILSNVGGQYYNILWDDAEGDFLHEAQQEKSGLFDYIFIDAPPIVPTFDMNLISEAVEGILFVVRSGEAPKHIITRAMKLLDRSKIVGAVLNRAKVPWLARAYEYGYYAYVADK